MRYDPDIAAAAAAASLHTFGGVPVLKIPVHCLSLLLLTLLVSACADTPAATEAPAASAAPAAHEVAQTDADARKHCETVGKTGSRIHQRTICQTDEEASEAQDQVDQALTRVDTQSPTSISGGR